MKSYAKPRDGFHLAAVQGCPYEAWHAGGPLSTLSGKMTPTSSLAADSLEAAMAQSIHAISAGSKS